MELVKMPAFKGMKNAEPWAMPGTKKKDDKTVNGLPNIRF